MVCEMNILNEIFTYEKTFGFKHIFVFKKYF